MKDTMSLIARMIIPISVIVTLATSFIGWKAYSDARDSVAEATRILEISTLDAVGRELTTVMNLTRQHFAHSGGSHRYIISCCSS